MERAREIVRRVRLAHDAGAGFHLTDEEMETILTAAEGAEPMDVTPYKFEMFDGWPPDGEPGLFYGFDADCNSALLWWQDGNWYGVRWQFDLDRPVPQAFLRGDGTQGFVVKWARAPMRWSDGG